MRRTLALVLLAVALPARAEWFGDLYGGVAYSPRSDVVLVVGSPSGPADHTFFDVKWKTSPVFGARAGYWFNGWYGMGLDVFRFSADIPTQTVDVRILGATTPAALQEIDVSAWALAFDLVRLRYPMLVNADYPGGRLQPYVAGGPALFQVKAMNRSNGELTTDPASDRASGYKVGGGLSWQISKNAALFGEYRFTHVAAAPALKGAITGSAVPMKFDLDTHHLVGGVSFRF